MNPTQCWPDLCNSMSSSVMREESSKFVWNRIENPGGAVET